MPGEINRIHLTTPAADRFADPETITKPQTLRTWVDDLPYANPTGTAQMMLASVRQLNRHPGKVSQRAALMQIYLTPFTRIIETARKLSCKVNSGQTPSREATETITTASALCTEMSYGMKHVINEDAQARSKISAEDLALHIQQAIHSLSLGLMFEMCSYQAESRSNWREIFQLLMRAEQLGVVTLEIPGSTLDVEYEVSVLNSFKTILMTSILDTNRLGPDEIWASYDYLLWHASNARLLPLKHASGVSGNYILPLDGGKKPVIFDPESPPAQPDDYLLCETHRLNVQINQHLEMLKEDESAYIKGTEKISLETKRQILRQMLHIWHNNPKRRHERNEKFDRLSCAFGIGAAYHYLKDGSMRPQRKDAGTDQDYLNVDYSQPPPSELNISDSLDIYEFRQEDISPSGMGIITSNPDIPSLKMGQLITIESKIAKGESKLRLGVVRRIRKIDQNNREIGVQFLPGRQIPASLLPEIFGRKSTADLQPCLVLELGQSHPKAVITPHLIYHDARQYVLDISGGDTYRIVAAKPLETTACFDCFEYSILNLDQV